MYKHRTLTTKDKLICSQVVRGKQVLKNKSMSHGQARRKQDVLKANTEGRDSVTQ